MHKEDLKRYRDYLLIQMKKSCVDVRLDTEATPELVRNFSPHSLIICVGAKPITPLFQAPKRLCKPWMPTENWTHWGNGELSSEEAPWAVSWDWNLRRVTVMSQ